MTKAIKQFTINTKGFTDIIDIQKAYRKFSVDGCKIIGQGAKGIVYRYDADTIIKVYKKPDAIEEVEREKKLAKRAFVLGVPTAISYDIIKVDGTPATTENDGFKDAYKCSRCDEFYEDAEGTLVIGDADAYGAWKLNAGKIEKLEPTGEPTGEPTVEPTDPSDDNKGKGGLVVLIIVIILVVLLGVYACGYFFLYKKGKLDNSGIKVIYSFLPKSKEEK